MILLSITRSNTYTFKIRVSVCKIQDKNVKLLYLFVKTLETECVIDFLNEVDIVKTEEEFKKEDIINIFNKSIASISEFSQHEEVECFCDEKVQERVKKLKLNEGFCIVKKRWY